MIFDKMICYNCACGIRALMPLNEVYEGLISFLLPVAQKYKGHCLQPLPVEVSVSLLLNSLVAC